MDDLIYTDSNFNEIGVIDTYELDLDLARDRSFELTVPEHLIDIGGYWYVYNTEYGGRVDGFKTNTKEHKIKVIQLELEISKYDEQLLQYSILKETLKNGQ